jgi:hypothetical protein
MLNSGTVANDHNTAGWTNFAQPCETASTDSLRDALEGCDGNPEQIELGSFIGATGGVNEAILGHPAQTDLIDCWNQGHFDLDGDGNAEEPVDHDGDPDTPPVYPWTVKLPVIDCPGSNVPNCAEVLGAVSVNIAWILEKDNDIDADAPEYMYSPGMPGFWDYRDEDDGATRWNSFVQEFGLKMVDGQFATVENDGFKQKSVFFMPDCNYHSPTGGTGGTNFGVPAKTPVLVR